MYETPYGIIVFSFQNNHKNRDLSYFVNQNLLGGGGGDCFIIIKYGFSFNLEGTKSRKTYYFHVEICVD